MTEIRLNHLALVVDDLEGALGFWRDALGLPTAGSTETVAQEAVQVAFLDLGAARLELIQPTDSAGGVARYLQKRGPGMHHLCLEVADIESKISELLARGCDMINEIPRERAGRRYAFVHPASTGGVLLELYERA